MAIYGQSASLLRRSRTTNSSLFNQRKSHLWKKCWICFELTFLAELIGWISIRYRKNEQLSCSQVRNFRLSSWLQSHNKDNYIFISNRALHFKYLESVEPGFHGSFLFSIIRCYFIQDIGSSCLDRTQMYPLKVWI